MVQIKFVDSVEIEGLERAINDFLKTVESDAVKDIRVDFKELTATIQYELVEEWKKRMCCECQYWDDGGETSTSGICHEHGQRRRFNYKACECFKDVRG